MRRLTPATNSRRSNLTMARVTPTSWGYAHGHRVVYTAYDPGTVRLGRVGLVWTVVHIIGHAAVAGALQRLPDAQREVILLRFVEDLTTSAIAQELNRTPDSVTGLLRRGLKALRQGLESES